MKKTLRDYIEDAREKGIALGHFNISDSNQFNAIVAAAKEVSVPVIVGVSEGERSFIGARQAVALVQSVRKEGFPVFLNADHTYSVAKVKEAIDLGFDSVIFDGAKLPHAENAKATRECVEYAKRAPREVLVEGELGYIGVSSKILDALPEGAAVGDAMLTTSEELAQYVRETGVDLVAPAVGNIHGMVKSGNPKLNVKRIGELAEVAGVPLVLHGGSGSSDEEFKDAVRAGIAVAHINTELRLTYRRGLEKGLAGNPEEIAPYRFLETAILDMKRYVVGKLRVLSGR